MKSTTKTFVASACALACASLASAATFTAGDLLIAFRSTSVNNVFFYNVGSSVSFRDNGSQGQVADIGTHLESTFGAGWFTDSDVSWGIIGVRNNSDPTPPFGAVPAVVNGDPSATLYASIGTTTPGVSTAWGTYTESFVVSAATKMRGVLDIGVNSFINQTAVANSNDRGVVQSTALSNWDNETLKSADFDLFTGGIEGSFNTGTEFAYLDVYRILSTTNGASPSGTLGVGSYETTFSINASGEVFAVDVSAVPEPSTYAALAGFAALGLALSRRRSRKV
jgi:hypothetical protein